MHGKNRTYDPENLIRRGRKRKSGRLPAFPREKKWSLHVFKPVPAREKARTEEVFLGHPGGRVQACIKETAIPGPYFKGPMIELEAHSMPKEAVGKRGEKRNTREVRAANPMKQGRVTLTASKDFVRRPRTNQQEKSPNANELERCCPKGGGDLLRGTFCGNFLLGGLAKKGGGLQDFTSRSFPPSAGRFRIKVDRLVWRRGERGGRIGGGRISSTAPEYWLLPFMGPHPLRREKKVIHGGPGCPEESRLIVRKVAKDPLGKDIHLQLREGKRLGKERKRWGLWSILGKKDCLQRGTKVAATVVISIRKKSQRRRGEKSG